MTPQTPITVIGGGIAGLVASITAAEFDCPVILHEANHRLGGRAQTSTGLYLANLGPHVLYDDGPFWTWLAERGLVNSSLAPRAPFGALSSIRFRVDGRRRRMPPARVASALARRSRRAPVDSAFRDWATEQWDPETAALLSNLAGVFSFDSDPGRLSAAFVWERLLRVFKPQIPTARYLRGGWSSLVDRLADHARSLGVTIVTNSLVDHVPEERPVIVATELSAARRLLGDESLCWEGSQVVLLDLGIESRRGDPFVLSDLDGSGWVEQFSAADRSLSPEGHSLLQVQVGLRFGETMAEGVHRAEELVECGYPDWRQREIWRRRSVLRSRSGALDLPGTSWGDRPKVDRGGGIFVAGDMVAAPGLLSEVSANAAIASVNLAMAAAASTSWPGRRQTA
jgi:phytoene dehydrogenase-like protein